MEELSDNQIESLVESKSALKKGLRELPVKVVADLIKFSYDDDQLSELIGNLTDEL